MLSTHILPEVSQTCQRVVIINKGRVVAVDTPDNLTARLRGAETMYVQVDASGADADGSARRVPGVTRVAVAGHARRGRPAFEVESETGRDVRRELASAIVDRGWGLLELRPMRMSLEEIFLQLTTRRDAPDARERRRAARRWRMSNILAIAHKELRSYFASPIAYVVIGFFALIFGFFFYVILLLTSTQSMQMRQFGGGAADERQRAADPAGVPERDGRHSCSSCR